MSTSTSRRITFSCGTSLNSRECLRALPGQRDYLGWEEGGPVPLVWRFGLSVSDGLVAIPEGASYVMKLRCGHWHACYGEPSPARLDASQLFAWCNSCSAAGSRQVLGLWKRS